MADLRSEANGCGSHLRDLQLCHLPDDDLRRQDFVLDAILVLEQVGVGLWQDDSNPVRELKPCFLAHRVQPMDQFVHAALPAKLVVELRRDRDGQRVVFGERPSFTRTALDEHLVGRELAPVHSNPTACELLELAGLQRCADRAQLLTELRPEHREIRFHAELDRLDRTELDFLDAELLRDLAGVALRRAGALLDEPTEWLAQLEPRVAASLTAELDDAAHLRDLGEQTIIRLTHLGPRLQKDRLGRVDGAQPAPKEVRQERHHGRNRLYRANERAPERPQRNLVPSPKAPAGAADVPVREIVDERFERPDERRRPVTLIRLRHLGDELLGAFEQPVVEGLELRRSLAAGLEAFDVGVVDEELDGVPESQQPALDLVRGPVAELQVLTRHLLAEHEPDDVRTDVL